MILDHEKLRASQLRVDVQNEIKHVMMKDSLEHGVRMMLIKSKNIVTMMPKQRNMNIRLVGPNAIRTAQPSAFWSKSLRIQGCFPAHALQTAARLKSSQLRSPLSNVQPIALRGLNPAVVSRKRRRPADNPIRPMYNRLHWMIIDSNCFFLLIAADSN